MTTTTCRRDFSAALSDLLDVLSSPYFVARAADPSVRTQQRSDAKAALSSVVERLTAAMAHPNVRFALPADEVRSLGPLIGEMGQLAELMGVRGAARATSRSRSTTAPIISIKPPTRREIFDDLDRLRLFHRKAH